MHSGLLLLLLGTLQISEDATTARGVLVRFMRSLDGLPVRHDRVFYTIPEFPFYSGGTTVRYYGFHPFTVCIRSSTGTLYEIHVDQYPRPEGFDRATAEPVPDADLKTIALHLTRECVRSPERLIVAGLEPRGDEVVVDLRPMIGAYEVFRTMSLIDVTLDRFSGYPTTLRLREAADRVPDPRFSTPRHNRAAYEERGLASLATLGAFTEGRLERSDLFWWRPATGSECIHEVPPELFQLGAENKLILCHALYVLGRAVEPPGRRIGAHILVDATTAKTLAIVIEPRTDLGPNEAGRDPVLDPKGRLVTPLGRLARALVPAPAEAKRDFPVAASWIGRNGDLVSVTLDATGRFLRHRDATYRLDRPVPTRDLAAPAVPKFGGGSPAARGLPVLGVQAG